MKFEAPELLADTNCVIGEGPIWHPEEGRLYYVDISQGLLHWHELSTAENGIAYKGEELGGVTLQADGGLVLYCTGCRVRILKNGNLSTVIDGIPGEEHTRFNDEIADTKGRVYVGTMSTDTRPGRLYQINLDGSYRVVSDGTDTPEGGYGTPNGMGFTPDRKCMYFNDSRTNRTYLFDYDEESGDLLNRRIIRQGAAASLLRPELNGRGDGLTVDAEGRIWMGEWDGGRVVCYSADENEAEGKPKMLHEIAIPAKKITCVTFGGNNYTDIFVTTALLDGTKETEGFGAGALYRIKTDVKGVPEFRSRIQI